MVKCDHDHGRRRRRRQALVAALVILLLIILILIIVYFTAYMPRDTRVYVRALQQNGLAKIVSTSSSASTVTVQNASFVLQVSVYNPNRATYHAFGSDGSLYFYGARIGYLPIPQFDVPWRGSTDFSFTLDATSGSLTPYSVGAPYVTPDLTSGYIPLTAVVTISGRVTTLNHFHHSGYSRRTCTINLSTSSKAMQTYFCN